MVLSRLPEGQGCLLDPADQTSQGVPEDLPAPFFRRNPPTRERPENTRRSVRPSELVTDRGEGFVFVSHLRSFQTFLSCLAWFPQVTLKDTN